MDDAYRASLDERDALDVLAMLRNDSDLALVSYGDRAVDLQLPDAVSPHAVQLAASYAEGSLRLVFWMGEKESARVRRSLVERARARGISLDLERDAVGRAPA